MGDALHFGALREGYQPAETAEKRGYQPSKGLDKGYQPGADIASTQPPAVGSSVVVPTPQNNAGSTASDSGGSGGTGNQDE